MRKDIKNFKKVKWEDVKIGQEIWIAGDLDFRGKPTVCYGPHTMMDPDNFQLKSGGNNELFYERWPCLYIPEKKFPDNLIIEERILYMMTFSDFEEWYKNEFTDFIEGNENAKSKKEMVNDIKDMLKRRNKIAKELTPKQKKVELLYHIAIQVDMINGILDHMTKDYIDDTWYEEDLDEIIETAKKCIHDAWKIHQVAKYMKVYVGWDLEDLKGIIYDCLSAEGKEMTAGNFKMKQADLMESPYLSDILKERKKEEKTDPCPECGGHLKGKGLHRGGGVECSNPKCDYWFCY